MRIACKYFTNYYHRGKNNYYRNMKVTMELWIRNSRGRLNHN